MSAASLITAAQFVHVPHARTALLASAHAPARRTRTLGSRTSLANMRRLLDYLRDELRTNGPRGNRDFKGAPVSGHYRGRKDTSIALYYLWLTGEVMIHHRQGFDRYYDLRERVAPPEFDYAASEQEAEELLCPQEYLLPGLDA